MFNLQCSSQQVAIKKNVCVGFFCKYRKFKLPRDFFFSYYFSYYHQSEWRRTARCRDKQPRDNISKKDKRSDSLLPFRCLIGRNAADSLLEPFKNSAWHFTGCLKMRSVYSTERKLSVLTGWMCVCVCVSIAGSSQVKCACETEPFKEFLKRLKKEWSGRRARGDSAAEVEGQRRRRGGREEREGSQEAGRLNETAARRLSHSTACRKSTLFRLTLGGGAVAANSWVTREHRVAYVFVYWSSLCFCHYYCTC